MTGLRVLSVLAVMAILTAAALVQIGSARAQPEIIETNVENGDVLDAPPELFHICFSEPVNTEDQPAGDAVDAQTPWRFDVMLPDGRGLGLRIVFEPDGECVDVEPGIPEDPPEGIWTFDWMVRSQATGEESSGVLTFRVGPGDPPSSDVSDTDDDDTILLLAIIAVAIGVAVIIGTTAAIVVMRRKRVEH